MSVSTRRVMVPYLFAEAVVGAKPHPSTIRSVTIIRHDLSKQTAC